jgi:hypothetical protein
LTVEENGDHAGAAVYHGGHGGAVAGFTILTLLLLSGACGLAWFLYKRQSRRATYAQFGNLQLSLYRGSSARSSGASRSELPLLQYLNLMLFQGTEI